MTTLGIQARDRLIVALDSPSIEAARRMVRELEGAVNFFKVGLVLQMAPGAEAFIQDLIRNGHKVFLDYKYYDIAETMKKAVARVADLGVSFLTIHGASPVIRGAVEGRGNSTLKLFAVTVLTNMDKTDIAELGYTEQSVEELVLFRARKALEAGCDGVIASGREARAIKEIARDRLLVVTPGIRPDGYPEDDQKRTVSAGDAVAAGADYLVVGRPITGKPEPRHAAEALVAEMQQAFNNSPATRPLTSVS
jgi:orotidine-5'-phosphate decarboxylase